MRNRFYILGALSAMAAVSCSPSAQNTDPDGGTEAMSAMPDMARASATTDGQAEPIVGVGIVTAVDREAGTIGLQHEPIPALNWSSMTMNFAADPEVLGDIAVGDSVSFTIKSPAESQVLTRIQKE